MVSLVSEVSDFLFSLKCAAYPTLLVLYGIWLGQVWI